jgi:hypothetical protein
MLKLVEHFNNTVTVIVISSAARNLIGTQYHNHTFLSINELKNCARGEKYLMKKNNRLKRQAKLVANDHKRKGLDGGTTFFVNIQVTPCQLVITSPKNLPQS